MGVFNNDLSINAQTRLSSMNITSRTGKKAIPKKINKNFTEFFIVYLVINKVITQLLDEKLCKKVA
jgi:hypothetical protein